MMNKAGVRAGALLVLGALVSLTASVEAQGAADGRLAAARPAILDRMMEQRWAALDEQRTAEEEEAFAYREAERMALHRSNYRIFVWGDASACEDAESCAPRRVVVRCRSMQLCDIELQLGERVRDVAMSDSINWEKFVTFTGAGRYQTPHIAVRSSGLGQVTSSLLIYTNRRTYYIELERTTSSDEERHMPLVAFHYPEEFRAQWMLRHGGQADAANPATLGQPPRSAGGGGASGAEMLPEVDPRNLNFEYEVDPEGRRRARRRIDWAPLRTFDDGEKTFIEMPVSMTRTSAPVLLVRENGQDVIVNYRIIGTMFVVDRLFQEAILIKGVGNGQERIAIRRTGND